MEEYTTVYRNLIYGSAMVIFLKKDGTVRTMLCTRNPRTIGLMYENGNMELGGHDKRCNIGNGNVGVFDMIIGEARSFNISRLTSIQYLGEIETLEQLNKAIEEYEEFKKAYENTGESEKLSMDSI